ncbi:hypothetical protein [Mesorhizobium dulcispinae]|uniref:hypothetical protein n=1 Tax=Mesorhizobium dulcispinae TaxID=3072316 RepID=UPI002A2429AE|nr:hypothetical protein [Mesorhizobium sp. VK23D]MDX8521885.1 hypothetical protein [Mesorhizobium sp. VK23D]
MAKREHKPPRSRPDSKGFDFGTPAPYIGAFNLDWVDHLTRSEVVGCAYAWAEASTVRAAVPTISLVVRDGILAKKAFDEFERWAEKSDDDAVELTVVFLQSGGYLLGLSPEPKRRLAKTAIPAIFDPLMMVEAWIKTLDTTSQPIRDLEVYSRSLIAPIIFEAVTLPSGVNQISQYTPFEAVPGTRPFLKFCTEFAHEGDDKMSPAAEMVLYSHLNRDRPKRKSAFKPNGAQTDARQWVQKRRNVLYELFPMTIFRARNSGLISAVSEKFSKHNIPKRHIEQAICNIVLSKVIDGENPHYDQIDRNSLLKRIVEGSIQYTENTGEVKKVAEISVDDVVSQIRLDVAYVTDVIGERKHNNSLGAQLTILKRRGYLDSA